MLGAGYESGPTPDCQDRTWNIYFVRGPRTAAALNLRPEKSITNSAVLVRTRWPIGRKGEVLSFGFMPHFLSFPIGNWERVCDLAGLKLIDPRWPVEKVLREIESCSVLISEALHGAIVADALRVPWIAALPLDHSLRGKWLDWTESVNVAYRPQTLWPSSLYELRRKLFRGIILDESLPYAHASSSVSSASKSFFPPRIKERVQEALIELAARRLQRIEAVSPTLSDDAIIDSRTEQALLQVERFKQNHIERKRPD